MIMSFINRINTRTKLNKTALQAHLKKRTSSFFLQTVRGSMTVEAAFAIPFFLFFMVNILSLILVFGEYSKNLSELHQQGKEMSLYAHLSQNTNEMVNLTKVQEIGSMIPIIAFPSSATIVNCRVRKWTGYDVTKTNYMESQEEYVYITETGEVYHRSQSCSFLNPSIRCTLKETAIQKRNHNGEKYRPCKSCGGYGGLELVYITEYGNRYHLNIRCSGLKRTIKTIPLSKVNHKRACSKCG